MFILNNSLSYTEFFSDSSYFLFLKSVQLRNVPNVSVHILNLINKICEVRLKTPFCLQCQIKLEFTLSVKKPWGKPKKSTKLEQKKQNIYIYILWEEKEKETTSSSHIKILQLRIV